MMRICGIVGWKNTGKTGLTERLVAEFTARGLVVSTIKHAHHSTDVDTPGTDSHRHRAAGAREVLLSSGNRWALMHELRGASEPDLETLLAKLSPADLILVEGFKRGSHPRIEAHRAEAGRDVLAREDRAILAVASDTPLDGLTCPVLDLNDTSGIADFLSAKLNLGSAA